MAGVFGIGCDGELTPAEVLERVAEVARAGGLAGTRGLTAPVVERLDAAVEAMPTEASAQALRCSGARWGGHHPRGAARRAALAVGASTVYLDPGPPWAPPPGWPQPSWKRPTSRRPTAC